MKLELEGVGSTCVSVEVVEAVLSRAQWQQQ